MANTIVHKKSSTPGAVPASGSLTAGELAINTADGIIYLKKDSGVVVPANAVPDPYDLGTYPLITISSQPSNASVGLNGSATFSVTAAATSPSATLAYQWQRSVNSGSTWSNVSGATSSSLTLTNLQSGSNGYQYRCLLAANLSSVTSSTATLTVVSFTPTAVLLTSGTTYTVPTGATTMKAWAVGAGGGYLNISGAGGCAFKTWSVSGGNTISYGIGATANANTAGGDTTVTFGGVTITGGGGRGYPTSTGGTYSGGDGGANGGAGSLSGVNSYGGAVGGNGASLASCGRRPATDVSGLLAAVALAGGKATEDCSSGGAFGSSAVYQKYSARLNAGLGGGGAGAATAQASNGAVVLYFT